jgi:hypothetical protein
MGMLVTILGLIAFLILPKFIRKKPPSKVLLPENYYIVTITDETVLVSFKDEQLGSVNWKELHTIMLINTDQGPWLPDIWLTLISDNSKCMIPHGSKGFDMVYDIVSKYESFNFDNELESMTCIANAEFLLWTNKSPIIST